MPSTLRRLLWLLPSAFDSFLFPSQSFCASLYNQIHTRGVLYFIFFLWWMEYIKGEVENMAQTPCLHITNILYHRLLRCAAVKETENGNSLSYFYLAKGVAFWSLLFAASSVAGVTGHLTAGKDGEYTARAKLMAKHKVHSHLNCISDITLRGWFL